MDVVATIDIVETDEAQEREHVPRVFRNRTCPYGTLNDADFRRDFRFTRPVFDKICAMLEDDLRPQAWQETVMTVADKVALGIHLLGRNVMQRDSAYIISCHQGTVSKALMEFVRAINKRAPEFIPWPNAQECRELRMSFYRRYRLPVVIGVIDGTHCCIQRPHEHKEDYVCRKGYHSLNIGMVVDFDRKIRWVCMRWHTIRVSSGRLPSMRS